MEIIAFIGSSQTKRHIDRYTADAVYAAMARRWLILVGDNSRGVDKVVTDVLLHHKYSNLAVVSSASGKRADTQFRDQTMIDMADMVMFIWNGKSKGTQLAYDYAVIRRRKCWLVDFSKRPSRKEEPPLITEHLEIPELITQKELI